MEDSQLAHSVPRRVQGLPHRTPSSHGMAWETRNPPPEAVSGVAVANPTNPLVLMALAPSDSAQAIPANGHEHKTDAGPCAIPCGLRCGSDVR